MDTLYIFKLPKAVNGQTHVRVTQEIRDARRTNIVGYYGKLSTGGKWTEAEKMHTFDPDIEGGHRVDLVEAANAAGRPSTLADHDIRSDDLLKWLEEDLAVISERIEARRPVEEAVA